MNIPATLAACREAWKRQMAELESAQRENPVRANEPK